MKRPRFAVVIATHKRPGLLSGRALPSAANQTRRPDIVVVVGENPRARDRGIVDKFSARTGIAAEYLHNWRNPGAGFGAHNSARNVGALYLLASGYSPENTYLCILDDDDEWLPHHLKQAESALIESGGRVNFMLCPYARRETTGSYVRNPPPRLNGRDFLTGNPGVEGTTLIVRMSEFLRAGMFDESLPACDDRDMCFRLSLLPKIYYKPLSEPSAVYYGDESRERLTLRRGAAQLEGLNRFADKYRGWMERGEYAAFCKRGHVLFGWTETKRACGIKTGRKSGVNKPRASGGVRGGKISLVVGVIVHPGQKNNPLFADILRLSKSRGLACLDVVVMPSSGGGRALRGEMGTWRRAGLRMHCIDGGQIRKFMRGVLSLQSGRKTRPIGINRTILQHAVSHFASSYKNPVCWILDGDNRLHGLKAKPGGVAKFYPDYVGEFIKLRGAGCDVAVGEINGAAPLPRAFTVRAQMVDLLHLLARLQKNSSDKHRPAAGIAAEKSGIAENYYHDCFPQPHLEQPVGLPPGKYSYREFLRALPGLLMRVLSGDAVTRPLLTTGFNGARHIHRGGNTLVFNAEILLQHPNTISSGEESGIRREDEIWRVMSGCGLNSKVVSGNFPVAQSREGEPPRAPDIRRMAEDIAGHAVVAGLRAVLGNKKFKHPDDAVDFILRNKAAFNRGVWSAAGHRLCMARVSFFRICGLAASMLGVINSGGEKNARAAAALKDIELRFNPEKARLLEDGVSEKLQADKLDKMLRHYPALRQNYAGREIGWGQWIRKERRQNASELLAEKNVSGKPLRFLGHGGEGAVFTDEEKTFKVLHRWYARKDITSPCFLPSLRGQWRGGEALYPVLSAQENGGDLIISQPFEKTAPYKGGCGAGMTALLAFLKKQGIVLWDIAPKNLRRAGDRVRLIDYGQHMNPFTERDFDLSVRKAWLSWRCAARDDLRALLTASLTNANLPELHEYKTMKAAVERYAALHRPEDFALRAAMKYTPRRALDYGCGKGKDAAALAADGVQTDAFDPNLTRKAAARLKASGVRYSQQPPQGENVYDVVLLRHVLCEIESDAEFRECLRNIRRLVKSSGKVVATMCAPAGVVPNTTCARNMLPRGADFNKTFCYRKVVHASGNIRAHVYRPESVLLAEFAAAGLKIVSRRIFADINLDTFQTCEGVLQWVLAPRGAAGGK